MRAELISTNIINYTENFNLLLEKTGKWNINRTDFVRVKQPKYYLENNDRTRCPKKVLYRK